MSAIWGMIHLHGKQVDKKSFVKMKNAYADCVIDRYDELQHESVKMGCGIQHFTKESEKEQMPFEEDGIYFDADIVLDNRDELLEELNKTVMLGRDISDGRLAFEMIKKYGERSFEKMLGAYAIVYYDSKNEIIYLINDVVGNRTVYYKIENDILYYSSLLEGIHQVLDLKKDEKWYVEFLAQDYINCFMDNESTPYCGVKRVPVCSYIQLVNGKLDTHKYWNPIETIVKKNYKKDDDAKIVFQSMWKKIVESVIRSEETSILLSAGYDSNAIASIAAPLLREKGKKLHSYTSVPIDEYVAKRDRVIEDESFEVKKTAQYYGNIDTHFVKAEGINPWDYNGEANKITESPNKSGCNIMWIVESARLAYEQGSRLLLMGGYGNNCLSCSGMRRYCDDLFLRGRFVQLWHELKCLSRRYGMSRRVVIKKIVEDCIKKDDNHDDNLYMKSYVNIDTADRYHCRDGLKKNFINDKSKKRFYNEKNQLVYQESAFRQIGELGMKISLYTGVLLRDPTLDKRLIEFGLSLPLECFSKDGIDRRLVAVYLKDYMPEHIINCRGKGRQSADFVKRIEPEWERIIQEWRDTYSKYYDSKIIEVERAMISLEKVNDISDCDSEFLNRHIYTLGALMHYNE